MRHLKYTVFTNVSKYSEWIMESITIQIDHKLLAGCLMIRLDYDCVEGRIYWTSWTDKKIFITTNH